LEGREACLDGAKGRPERQRRLQGESVAARANGLSRQGKGIASGQDETAKAFRKGEEPRPGERAGPPAIVSDEEPRKAVLVFEQARYDAGAPPCPLSESPWQDRRSARVGHLAQGLGGGSVFRDLILKADPQNLETFARSNLSARHHQDPRGGGGFARQPVRSGLLRRLHAPAERRVLLEALAEAGEGILVSGFGQKEAARGGFGKGELLPCGGEITVRRLEELPQAEAALKVDVPVDEQSVCNGFHIDEGILTADGTVAGATDRCWASGFGDRRTEVGGRRTEDEGLKAEDGGLKAEVGGRRDGEK